MLEVIESDIRRLYESETVELKEIYTPDLKKEVVAFVNTSGGIIYIGVKDNGEIIGIDNPDFIMQQVSNALRDRIRPDVSMFINVVLLNEADRFYSKFEVSQGTKKTYYLSDKGHFGLRYLTAVHTIPMGGVTRIKMKKVVLIILTMLLILTGCTKEKNITFEGQIESISDQSMIITTKADVGFDKASVGLSSAKIAGELAEGKKVKVTIYPEVRETYPVQVTATKIEVIDVAYKKISAKEAKEMMEKGEYGAILDVRTLEEYNEGHIEGSVLLPNNEIKDKAEITLYDKEEVVLIYCRSGRRSEVAAKELIDMGYTNVYDFGGIIDWPYEIVKD